jgi:hypothetical protein
MLSHVEPLARTMKDGHREANCCRIYIHALLHVTSSAHCTHEQIIFFILGHPAHQVPFPSSATHSHVGGLAAASPYVHPTAVGDMVTMVGMHSALETYCHCHNLPV